MITPSSAPAMVGETFEANLSFCQNASYYSRWKNNNTSRVKVFQLKSKVSDKYNKSEMMNGTHDCCMLSQCEIHTP